jgi:hypothetical protein
LVEGFVLTATSALGIVVRGQNRPGSPFRSKIKLEIPPFASETRAYLVDLLESLNHSPLNHRDFVTR